MKLNSNTFFSSDWHLDHANVLSYNNRPFVDLQAQMDYFRNAILSLPINATLILLGDIVTSKKNINAILEYVFGTRKDITYFFVPGNHDKYFTKQFLMYGKVEHYLEAKYGDKKIIMSHYPFAEWDRAHFGTLHFHGHTHAHFTVEKHGILAAGKRLDVGWDTANKIFHIDEAVSTADSKPIFNPVHSRNNGLINI